MLQWCYPFFREIEELTHYVYPLYFHLFLSQPAFEFNIKLESGHWHVFLAFRFFSEAHFDGHSAYRLLTALSKNQSNLLTGESLWLASWREVCCAVLFKVKKKKTPLLTRQGFSVETQVYKRFRKDLSLDISPVEKGRKAVEQLAPSACLRQHRTSLVSIKMFAGY